MAKYAVEKVWRGNPRQREIVGVIDAATADAACQQMAEACGEPSPLAYHDGDHYLDARRATAIEIEDAEEEGYGEI